MTNSIVGTAARNTSPQLSNPQKINVFVGQSGTAKRLEDDDSLVTTGRPGRLINSSDGPGARHHDQRYVALVSLVGQSPNMASATVEVPLHSETRAVRYSVGPPGPIRANDLRTTRLDTSVVVEIETG